MKSLAVYCGSRMGNASIYRETAIELGHLLAEKNITLVYGGGDVGLMGAVAEAALEKKGHVIGVIPKSLVDRELALHTVSELIVVDTMHERKARMAECSDAFVAIPGGVGTLEEIFEMITWSQLGFHAKPCGFLNTDGYYDQLLAFLDEMVSSGFLKQPARDKILVRDTPESLLDCYQTLVG